MQFSPVVQHAECPSEEKMPQGVQTSVEASPKAAGSLRPSARRAFWCTVLVLLPLLAAGPIVYRGHFAPAPPTMHQHITLWTDIPRDYRAEWNFTGLVFSVIKPLYMRIAEAVAPYWEQFEQLSPAVQAFSVVASLCTAWVMVSVGVATARFFFLVAKLAMGFVCSAVTGAKDVTCKLMERAAARTSAVWKRLARRIGSWRSAPKTTFSEPVPGVPPADQARTICLMDADATYVVPSEGKPFFSAKVAGVRYCYPAYKGFTPDMVRAARSRVISREQKSTAQPTVLTRPSSWPQCAGYFYDVTEKELIGHFNKVHIKSGKIDGQYLVTAHHVQAQFLLRIRAGHSVALANPGKATLHFVSKHKDPEVVRKETIDWANQATVVFGVDLVRIPFTCQDFKSAKIARRSTTAPEFYSKREADLTTVMPSKLVATNVPIYKLHDASTDEGDSGCGGYESVSSTPAISYVHLGAHTATKMNVCVDLTELYPSFSPPVIKAETPNDESHSHSSKWDGEADIDSHKQIHGDPDAERSWFVDDQDRIGNLPNAVLQGKKTILCDDGQYRNWADATEYEDSLNDDREAGYKSRRAVYEPEGLTEREYLTGRRALKRISDTARAKQNTIANESVNSSSSVTELELEVQELKKHNKTLGLAQADIAQQLRATAQALNAVTEEYRARKAADKELLAQNQAVMQQNQAKLDHVNSLLHEATQRVKTQQEQVIEYHRQMAEERGNMVQVQLQLPSPPVPAPQNPETQKTQASALAQVNTSGGPKDGDHHKPLETQASALAQANTQEEKVEQKEEKKSSCKPETKRNRNHGSKLSGTKLFNKTDGRPLTLPPTALEDQIDQAAAAAKIRAEARANVDRRKEEKRLNNARAAAALKQYKASQQRLAEISKEEVEEQLCCQVDIEQSEAAKSVKQEAVPTKPLSLTPDTSDIDSVLEDFQLPAPSTHDSKASA